MTAEYETTINVLLAENDKLIKLVDWQNDEIERLRSELNQIRRFALNGEMDTVVSDEIDRLRLVLRRVRTAIFDAKPEVLTDTLWMHDRRGETVVDCIDDALNDYDWEVRDRAALGEKE